MVCQGLAFLFCAISCNVLVAGLRDTSELVQFSSGEEFVGSSKSTDDVLHTVDDVLRNRDGANYSTRYDSDCGGHPAKDDISTRCKQPGVGRWDELLCSQCGRFGFNTWDTHPKCEIWCCDWNRKKPHDMCECTPRGESFVMNWNANYIVGLNTAEKCCGRDQNWNPAISHQNHEVCGCGHVGTETNYGGHCSDCCSGECDGNNWCIPRACAKKGESGKCCRTINDQTHPYDLPDTGKCGCFHAGDQLNPNDVVDYTNCCSGKANAAGNACACFDDENLVLPDGTLPTDCCSGKLTDDNKHCKAATCTEVGGTLETAGDHCCSGKTEEGDEKRCACVPSGEKPGDEATNRDCCSLKLEDGVCQFLFKGDPVPNNTDPGVCNSGQKDSDNRCRCVNKGAESDHESDCCSGAYLNLETKGNMCGCVPIDGTLEYGAGKGNCCTKTAAKGICRCAVPSSPVLPMMKAEQDCCAKDTPSGSAFCGCLGPDAQQNVTYEDSKVCCSGYDGHGCSCIADGHAIPSWTKDTACCSGKIVETEGEHVCSDCDMQCYLDRYPDLQIEFGAVATGNTNHGEAKTGLNTGDEAQKHWNAHGKNEGRDCTCPAGDRTENCNFDCYLARYPDLKAQQWSAAQAEQHWNEFGKNEGRDCRCAGTQDEMPLPPKMTLPPTVVDAKMR